MKCSVKYFLVTASIVFSSFTFYPALASHLAGQDFTYVLVDSSGGLYHYRVTLTLFEDCLNGQPMANDEDNPVYLAVFDEAGDYAKIDTAVHYSSSDTSSAIWSACTEGAVTAFCKVKKTFTKDYYLPLSSRGYIVVYQRCCWNNLANIKNAEDMGTTASCYIPASVIATHNNSAVFTNYPPFYIAADSPVVFNCSATDADGDSLSYALCTPYSGAGDPSNSKPIPGPPPFTPLGFVSPLSYNNPVNCSVPLAIDPVTGLLTGTPNASGTFLVTVCCSEWRGGVLINTVQREFEFITGGCRQEILSPPKGTVDIFPNPATSELSISSNDTISQITIYNVLGQRIFSQEYKPRTNIFVFYLQQETIGVSEFPPGIYFVRVNGSIVKKFLKP